MARLVTSGAEWHYALTTEVATSPDGIISGAVTIDTTNMRSGAACFSYAASATAAFSEWDFTAPSTGVSVIGRIYLRKSANPAAQQTIMQFMSGATVLYNIKLNTDGSIALYYQSTQIGSNSAVLSNSTYYCIELSTTISTAAGSDDTASARINQADAFASETNVARATLMPAIMRAGWVTGGGVAGPTLQIDDVAVNDSSGAAQNTWPGAGSIVLLKPTADTAVGTGWTLGTGTAISAGSGSTAVKNTPPVGVADLTAGSDTKQIRNATSNANVNYDATMATYTAAGIGSSDIITVIVPIVSTAAPVTTSSKQGTVGVVSNPTITNIALGAGGTSGAFWSGVAAGTYPTGWKWSYGTTTYNPTVTKGTAPVMRITQVTSSTRIAMVDAMGIYVEYFTPFAYTESATIASVSSVGSGAYSMLNAVAVTGDVITDATRTANVQGDGL